MHLFLDTAATVFIEFFVACFLFCKVNHGVGGPVEYGTGMERGVLLFALCLPCCFDTN